jgi:hypothetical protein
VLNGLVFLQVIEPTRKIHARQKWAPRHIPYLTHRNLRSRRRKVLMKNIRFSLDTKAIS